MLSRRQLIQGAGAAAALAASASVTVSWPRLALARGLLTDYTLDEVTARALAAAKAAGATYADIRVVRRVAESLHTREDHVTGVGSSDSYGLGVRVIAGGAWGFAASARVDGAEAERIARLAVDIAKANAKVVRRPVELAPVKPVTAAWQTPLTRDPFKIPLAEKAAFLLAINADVMAVPGVKFCTSSFDALGEWKLLVTSEGSRIEQEITRIEPGYSATAVDAKTGEFVSREHELPPSQAGWEYVEGSTLRADARKIGEEAVAKLKAPGVTPGKRDLILAPSNLWLTIHESVGHSTELDRALGYEANLAGTSFATVDKLGTLRFGSDIVTLFADKTSPGGLASCGYDDDGVPTGRWDLVKKGLFVGYQTTREQAAWIKEPASRATAYGEDFKAFPFQRMPNVSLAPGAADKGVADLIAATDDGIYITGNGSWSIDHQRYNFQFGGQMFHEIKKGKLTRPLKDVAYQANSLDFWRSCDMIAGQREWVMGGTLGDGKGEPVQSNGVSHGCSPARFRKVNVLSTNTRGA
ncbi:MAG: TldD/PmbA family protein [Deltaproteobacteria bacterium]|nr:TldD/PmbA family protein [Deltaproteobacteria bacterium]